MNTNHKKISQNEGQRLNWKITYCDKMTLKTIFLFAIIATLITLAFSEEKSYKDRLESFITENENKLEDLTPENLAKIRNLATSVDAYKKLVSNPFFNREQQQSCFNWHGKYCGKFK